MIFVAMFDYLGLHIPALGAFLVCVLVVAVLFFLAYKWGIHEANKRWTHDVECMPKVIEQAIREKMEKRIVALGVRNKYLQERNDAMMPAFAALATIAQEMLKERKT